MGRLLLFFVLVPMLVDILFGGDFFERGEVENRLYSVEFLIFLFFVGYNKSTGVVTLGNSILKNKYTMKRTHMIVSVFCAISLLAGPLSAKTVHTIGDSTMANYDESTTDQRGWAQMFQQFFDGTITVNNRGKSGSSSKSFYEESAYWASVKKQIVEGDYVIIQFAHNDEKNNGMDGDSVRAKTGDLTVDYRGTTPQGSYKEYLRRYVNETRALGATPILVSSMCRKYFSGNTIRRNGRHDLGDSFSILNDDGTISTGNKIPESDHSMDYPYAMKEVAEEMDVPYIDLTTKSAELFASYGEAACTELLFRENDGTHPIALGATLMARIVAQEMAAQGILADHILQNADLLVNPTSVDFGKAYTGQQLVREVSVSGFDLTPADGTVTVTASEGFEVSADRDNYQSSLSLSYSEGNLDYTRIYVRTTVSGAGEVSGMLSFTNGNHTKDIPLSCTGIELSGGEEVVLRWPLDKDDSYILTGPAIAVPQSWSEMTVQRYASPNANTVWPDWCEFVNGQLTQRNLIVGEVWPAGEIDEVSTRYIQFGITASEGTVLHIDSIGLYVCGAGGSGMRCRISYSTQPDFADATSIAELTSAMTANTMYAIQYQPVVELQAGETLLLRVYPWYSSQATGKTICLSHVTLHGVASSASAISETAVPGATLVRTLYYDICGTLLPVVPEHGIYFKKEIYSDGTNLVTKLIR